MKNKKDTFNRGFILAGLMNLSVLIFSRLFTNETIPQYDPSVMSNFGLLMITIWGLAYISVAKRYNYVKWVVFVFALEKFIYGCIWIRWQINNSLLTVYEDDFMAGLFYSIYGINDWIFCLFFAYVFHKIIKTI